MNECFIASAPALAVTRLLEATFRKKTVETASEKPNLRALVFIRLSASIKIKNYIQKFPY